MERFTRQLNPPVRRVLRAVHALPTLGAYDASLIVGRTQANVSAMRWGLVDPMVSYIDVWGALGASGGIAFGDAGDLAGRLGV